MIDFVDLATQCAPTVAHQTMAAVVSVESSYNPYAIGVVGGRLVRQPKTLDEAVATAEALDKAGYNFSMGIAQVNRYNLPKYKLTYRQAFDPCANLRAGSKILEDCYVRALPRRPEPQYALQAAFSCYYSGNFNRGFRPDRKGEPSYVQKILVASGGPVRPIQVVPAINRSRGVAATPSVTPVKAAPADAPLKRTTTARRQSAGAVLVGEAPQAPQPQATPASLEALAQQVSAARAVEGQDAPAPVADNGVVF